MRKKGVSDNMVDCIKKMYGNTKFCVKYCGNKVTDFVEQRRGVRQMCSLGPYLIFLLIILWITLVKVMFMHQ
jgi:predicted nucleic acid-binding Zn ribbon protein